jgi:hypothetical protein
MDFNEGIKVWVNGPDLFYFVEVLEYEKGCGEAKYLEGHQIHSVPTDDAPFWKMFKYDARFYSDFEIRIYRCDDNEGMLLVYSHRYNDMGKYVKFEITNKNKQETELWVERILKIEPQNIIWINRLIIAYAKSNQRSKSIELAEKSLLQYGRVFVFEKNLEIATRRVEGQMRKTDIPAPSLCKNKTKVSAIVSVYNSSKF